MRDIGHKDFPVIRIQNQCYQLVALLRGYNLAEARGHLSKFGGSYAYYCSREVEISAISDML